MEKEASDRGLHQWIPLITKLVWPFFIIIALFVFHKQVSEIYTIFLEGIKSGRSIELGFIKLGEAANTTEISDLSDKEISISGIGGSSEVVSKGSISQLMKIQQALKKEPSKKVNTLLITDRGHYTSEILREYISTLGTRFIIFQKRGKFDGWIAASTFVAQLPVREQDIRYEALKSTIFGIQKERVYPTYSAKKVLQIMEELRTDSIPVVDKSEKWLFFANRGEILARLMTTIILEKK